MSKQDDTKLRNLQTCVLKVNIHCDGCKLKVKKLLQKVDGVFHISIDAEKGIATVSGDADPVSLVKKLHKAGKHAELLFPKGINITQLQKTQLVNAKAQQNKDNKKPSKGGGGGGKPPKGQPTPVAQPQQMKGLKDLKFPSLKGLKLPFHKGSKSAKFDPKSEVGDEGSDYDDFDDEDDDYDDEDLEDFDSFDADFEEDFSKLNLKPGNAQPVIPDKKAVGSGGWNGKKGGAAVDIPVQIKGTSSEGKNGKKGGGNETKMHGANGGKNTGKGGGAPDPKNGHNSKTNPNANTTKKGSGKNDATGAGGGPMARPEGFPPAYMNNPHAGVMPASLQGLPAGMMPPGYFPGGGMPPEMMAAAAGGGANPYQQQYLAALMQQQRMMMMNGQDRGYAPMMAYPRPQAPVPAPPYGEHYCNYFSDENANSCSVM
ncbi:hypothetical protein HPP92_013678 [Vanilla planifolia]|uniref:HMA domain-containing protein n=1 Tax=Vanilla planifolia TaxID=51239 RepID=A0A835QY76_VANPL|nr:hypothetical protein HPP92_013678 [Vanilla planifolia]